MSIAKWLSVATFILILSANVLGFMADNGHNVVHQHVTVGVAAALVGLVSMVMVLRTR